MCLIYSVCKGQNWNSDPYLLILKPYPLDYPIRTSLVQKARAEDIQEK